MPKIVKTGPEQTDRLSLTLFEIYERRRKYPRAILNIPVKIRMDTGIKGEATLYDISPDGIQVRCNRETARIICPEGKITKENVKRHLEVIFVLPYRRRKKAVCIRVMPVYLLFIAVDLIAFGMQFHRKDKETLKSIEDYIDYELAPSIEELEEILKEKIGKTLPREIRAPTEEYTDEGKHEKGKKKSDTDEPEYNLVRISKDIQDIRRYTDIIHKVLNKLTKELEDIETQLDLKE
ncbi:MAG: hypothetical protein A2W28_11235 [Gammaproteobacteria bacterium RBG_16_51_14]|nr:MAG: hypothetical protein A2W28_11235 [Gammaproteobacteria bacterium RBG_16_51_14]